MKPVYCTHIVTTRQKATLVRIELAFGVSASFQDDETFMINAKLKIQEEE
jgi:hypothetical protein